MARGTSQTGYRGALGATRASRVHWSSGGRGLVLVDVYEGINAETDPELARRVLSTDPAQGLNTVAGPDGRRDLIPVPIVFHDPGAELFALVLPESLRHRELAERAALYAALAADREHDVPAYVRDLVVVYGADGLARHLAARGAAHQQVAAADEHGQELAVRLRELEQREQALAAVRAELDHMAADVERRGEALRQREAQLDGQTRVEPAPPTLQAREGRAAPSGTGEALAAAVRSAARRAAEREGRRGGDEEGDFTPLPRPVPHEEIVTHPFELLGPGDLAKAIVQPARAATASPAAPVPAAAPPSPATAVLAKAYDGTTVRLAARVADNQLEGLLSDRIDVRVQLHRTAAYPLVVLTVGVDGDADGSEPLSFPFDVAGETDRAVLAALGRDFSFQLELFDAADRPVSRRAIRADLAENVRYVLSAAEDALEGGLSAERSFDRALRTWSAADFDRHGRRARQRSEFRDDVLDHLETPAQVARALALAAHFSEPENEEYLLLLRGYSLARWRQRRRQVLVRAVEHGLWPGVTLAQIAVSESAARSRKDLVQRLLRSFARAVADGVCDLDDAAVEANWSALQAEAAALGIVLERRADGRPTPASPGSDPLPTVSGIIGDERHEPARGEDEMWAPLHARRDGGGPVDRLSVGDLLAALDDKDRRREAAIELADRRELGAIEPVFAALRRMTRGEAVRVLGHVVAFGDPAQPHLIEGLRSRKAFLRQGCALALGVLKSEAGIEAVCDLLVTEPTDIWREIARAVGEVGPGAVMSLVARLREAPAEMSERVAWALAHVASRGGRSQVETLSNGRDRAAAAAARQALEIADLVRRDDAAAAGASPPGRDQTVNRAFSRRFFEAMQRQSGDTGPLPADLFDVSDDALPFEDIDLLEDDAEPLDESDLLPG